MATLLSGVRYCVPVIVPRVSQSPTYSFYNAQSGRVQLDTFYGRRGRQQDSDSGRSGQQAGHGHLLPVVVARLPTAHGSPPCVRRVCVHVGVNGWVPPSVAVMVLRAWQ